MTDNTVTDLMQKKGWKPIRTAPKDREVMLADWYIPSDAAYDNGSRPCWSVGKGQFISDAIGWSGIAGQRPMLWFDGELQ